MWAWRLIWAWLVSPLTRTGTLEEAIAEFVRDLPDVTVRRALVDDLPPLLDGAGIPLPVEHDLYRERLDADDWTVLGMLRLLAVGAGRLRHLDGVSRDAFVGPFIPDSWTSRSRHLWNPGSGVFGGA